MQVDNTTEPHPSTVSVGPYLETTVGVFRVGEWNEEYGVYIKDITADAMQNCAVLTGREEANGFPLVGSAEDKTCPLSPIESGSGERKAREEGGDEEYSGFGPLESDGNGLKVSHRRLPLRSSPAHLSATGTAKMVQQGKDRRAVGEDTPLPCPAFLALPAETSFEWGSDKNRRTRTRRVQEAQQQQQQQQHGRRRRNHVKDVSRWAPGCTFPVDLSVLFDLSEEERAGSTVSFTSIAGYDNDSDFAWIVTDSTNPVDTDW